MIRFFDIIVLGLFLFISVLNYTLPDVDASCIRDKDWPLAPCFDTGPPSKAKYIERWTPYYEYKGSELMENKKLELFQSLENKTFDKWVQSSQHYNENYNIYSYYVSTGEIAKQFKFSGFRIEEYMSPKKQQSIFTKPYDLKCRNDLHPVILQSETYACVKDESRKKLLELDLIHEDYSQISVRHIRNFDVGHYVSVDIQNEGMVSVQPQSPFIHIFDSTGQILDVLNGTLKSFHGDSLRPGYSSNIKVWSDNTFDEHTKPGHYSVQIDYQSDIHQKKKSITHEFDIIDPILANFTINYPDDWNIQRLVSSSITSFYSRDWLETNPELYGLDGNERPWTISDKQRYHPSYHATSDDFGLLGITIQKTSLTASKYFELWNDACDYLDEISGCNIIQSNKIETRINDKSVIILNYVENIETRGTLSQDILSDRDITNIYEQNFISLIEFVDEQETWLIRGHYAISNEMSESKEILRDNVFSNIVNSFKIYDYEYKWHS